MYVIDITRGDGWDINDMMVGRDSMDAKSKTINYIMEYALANCNISIDKDVLDQNLNMKSFSLREFMKSNYSMDVKQDLLIQSIPTDKDHCLFVKHFDRNIDTMPNLYIFNKKEEKQAMSTLSYLMNESLIKKYENDLDLYEQKKFDVKHPSTLSHSSKDISCEIVSLYNGGLFLEELLNNASTLYEVKYKDLGGIDV